MVIDLGPSLVACKRMTHATISTNPCLYETSEIPYNGFGSMHALVAASHNNNRLCLDFLNAHGMDESTTEMRSGTQ
jgi:hypothetical protein